MACVGKAVFAFFRRKPSSFLQLQTLTMHTNSTQIESFAMKQCMMMNIIGFHMNRSSIQVKERGSVNVTLASLRVSLSVPIAPSAYSVPKSIGYERNKAVTNGDRILPSSRIVIEKTDPFLKEVPTLEDPISFVTPIVEKKAVRLIVIRRRKMKKHKLRKFRKRMYHVIARIKQRREANKEKIFQDELLAQMSRADQFDAEVWVEQFLHKSTTDPQTLIPKKKKQVKPTRYVLD